MSKTSYSKILIEFIQPLLDGTEDEEEYLNKATIGMIAWNFHLSDKFRTPFESPNDILKKIIHSNDEGKRIFNSLVRRKKMKFSDYDQVIVSVKINEKSDGSKTLMVFSVPADKI